MSENTKTILICFGIIGVIILLLAWRISSHDRQEVYECSRCEREFTNSDDVRSIRRTSMCEPCYEDYKFTEEVREEIEKYNERNRWFAI